MYKSSQTTGSVLLSQTSIFPNWIDTIKVETPKVKTIVPQMIQTPVMRATKKGISSEFFEKLQFKTSESLSGMSFFKKSIKEKIY